MAAHKLDALIAALDALRAASSHSDATRTLQRLALQAVADGVESARDFDASNIDALGELVTKVRAARTESNEKITLLIVEDDRLTARILTDALAADDRIILIARNAAEANALIREHDVALILLDLVLPDGDGRDLLMQLRATPATHVTPVLVSTSYTDPLTQSECFALGADAVLAKPVSPTALLAAVCAHLAHAAERRLEGWVDGLTMLPNRNAFMDAASRNVQLARRTQQPLAFAMIDLDNFKSVNDAYGHSTGDEVLRSCAQTIARALRTSDYVARWGGEELVVFMPDTTARGAVLALEKALRTVRLLEFRAEQAVFGITFSAGVAALLPDQNITDVVAEADRLLYVAKASGRNRIISSADEADPPKPRVLLVEDDEAVAFVVRRLLEREGYSVVHFNDGGAGLAAAREEHFALAILDLNVPIVDGFTIVTELRASATGSKLPILMLTGSSEERDIVHGFEVGVNDYVVKPFNSNELIARLNRLLPKR